MTLEKPLEYEVMHHYGSRRLKANVLTALERAGVEAAVMTAEDLSPIDEFHIGGRDATRHAVDKLLLRPEDDVLDVGCGIGGAARFMASSYGCRVTGVDLTAEYVELADELTSRTGLSDRVTHIRATALALPFEGGSFDAAVILHAGMNVENKAQMYDEVSRVLKPGGRLVIYDVMRIAPGQLQYPLPWAANEHLSFLATPTQSKSLLDAAGLVVRGMEDRSDAGLAYFAARQAAMAGADMGSALGPHLLMGEDANLKVRNTKAPIRAGILAPVEIIAVKRGGEC